MIPIHTPRLIIRNWQERDRRLFFQINSDDEVMRFFPSRRTRVEADELFDKLMKGIDETDFGFTALELVATGECIGFAGLHADDVAPSRPAGTIEIGWRLAREFWGKGYATEAAIALLEHGFETMHLDEIVSYAVWNNEASLAVMRRIGMTAEPSGDFDHPRAPDTHLQLKRHAFYRLGRDDWKKQRQTGR